MRVLIPTPLRSYTGGRAQVEARGATLAEVVDALDAAYPGLRFRVVDEQGDIRRHIKFFVSAELAEDLGVAVGEGDEVQLICALSGGAGPTR
jgi:molybdopterin converting factor small subunit